MHDCPVLVRDMSTARWDKRSKTSKELPNKRRKYGSKFNEEWIKNKDFCDWLSRVEGDDSRAYCSACSRSFDIEFIL